jgi:hypothetical protein
MRAACLLVLLSAAVGACGPTVDLSTGLAVQNVSTGWFDAGIVDGKTKLVPSMTFTLKNTSNQALPVLQLNALYHRVSEPKDEWGNAFLNVAGSEGLKAGATSDPLTLRSNLGYTGTDQTRDEMLHNSQFVDATVDLFAKYGSAQWKKIGQYPIERKLLVK